MWKLRVMAVTLSLAAMGLLQGAAKGGCGGNEPGIPGIDVGGPTGADWKVTYGDTMHIVVKKAGAVVATHDLSRIAGGSFDVDGVTLNLSDICKRSDVACPEEVFPDTVRMTQPGAQRHLLYVNFNKEGPLGGLKETTLLGNVDSNQDFKIELGIKAALLGTCGLLGVSYANGHIEADSNDPEKGVDLAHSHIVTAYSGGCILLGQGGGAGAGITVEFKIPFSAQRLN